MLTISAWKSFGTRGGIRTHAKLNWQKTDYCCSSHTFWAQECYPPSTLSLVFILVCLITTIAVINGSRPCLLNSNLSSYGLPYLIPSFCVKPASCGSHSLQTVVPDELFHFVENKLGLGEQIRSSLFNHYWSRRVLPEVPLITAGSCQYTPLIPLRGVIGQARHIHNWDKSQKFLCIINFLNIYIITKIFWKVKFLLSGAYGWAWTSDLSGMNRML